MLKKITIPQKLLGKNTIQNRLGKLWIISWVSEQTVVNELDVEGEILTNPQDIAEGVSMIIFQILVQIWPAKWAHQIVI